MLKKEDVLQNIEIVSQKLNEMAELLKKNEESIAKLLFQQESV